MKNKKEDINNGVKSEEVKSEKDLDLQFGLDSDFPDFDFEVDDNSKSYDKVSKFQKFVEKQLKKLEDFSSSKFGENAKITEIIKNFEPFKKDTTLDSLDQFKQAKDASEKLNLLLTVILIIVLIFSWKTTLALVKEIDQLDTDYTEQEKTIEMEQKNNEFLLRLRKDRNKLMKNIHTIYSAVPNADEKSEDVISMLEHMAKESRLEINAIGIRKVSENQVFYDDLWGVTDVYEYNFSLEGDLNKILNLIGSIRSSLRLMDIMSLTLEEDKNGKFKAGITLNAYNLIPYEDSFDENQE